ncbi:solute carrier family 49 member 4 homolog [Crassostrea virginica]
MTYSVNGNAPGPGLRTYGVRWYLLAIVSLHCCLQNAVWAEYPPIAQSAKLVYDWTDSDINMTLNYGNIGAIFLLLPVIWIVFAKGMRPAMLLCTSLTALGTILKALPVSNSLSSWLIPIGLFLNGSAGAVTMVGATVLSETWFPPTQRATATVFYLVSAGLGGALVFIVGPAVVPEPIEMCGNVTWSKGLNCSENKTNLNFHEVQDHLRILNFAESGIAVLLFISVCSYFPNKPLLPPSRSARETRLGMREGIRTAVTQWKFWYLTLLCSISTAVYGAWVTTSDVLLHPFGISQEVAGWMSFSGSVGGVIFGVFLSRLSDVLQRKMKTIMIVIFSMASIFFLLFILVLMKVLPNERWLLYSTYVSACVLTSGAQPLYFEITCENLFPVSEAIVSGSLSLLLNVASTVFLLLAMIPGMGHMWANWAVLVTTLLSAVLLYLFRGRYRRLDIDLDISESEDPPYKYKRLNS